VKARSSSMAARSMGRVEHTAWLPDSSDPRPGVDSVNP
jgi:hypothetical protein